MGVVHEVSRDSRLLHNLIQDRRVHRGFGEQHQRRRSQYGLQILQSNLRRQGRVIDTGMHDEAQELVNKIGRASCRERVEISVVAGALKEKRIEVVIRYGEYME